MEFRKSSSNVRESVNANMFGKINKLKTENLLLESKLKTIKDEMNT